MADTVLDAKTPKKRLSFNSPASAGTDSSWECFDSLLGELTPSSPYREAGVPQHEFLINPRPSGIGRVVREALQHLPPKLKDAALDLVQDLFLGTGGPVRVTTLCSGSDGVIDSMKECCVLVDSSIRL